MRRKCRPGATIETRLLSWTDKTDSCWLWRGYRDRNGYGQLTINKQTRKSHRVSWEIFRGPIPADKCVLHKCDVGSCINPDHLYLGTKADNTRDALERNRLRPPVGERNWRCKLTEKRVTEIRKLRASGMMLKHLEKKFGISNGQISQIANHKAWKHVK